MPTTLPSTDDDPRRFMPMNLLDRLAEAIEPLVVTRPVYVVALLGLCAAFGSALILTGTYRWLGALWLAGFTLVATFVANRFWEMQPPQRFMVENVL